MKITKEIVDCILDSEYTEQDYDKKSGGNVEIQYNISNLFHSREFGEYAIQKILNAYKNVMKE